MRDGRFCAHPLLERLAGRPPTARGAGQPRPRHHRGATSTGSSTRCARWSRAARAGPTRWSAAGGARPPTRATPTRWASARPARPARLRPTRAETALRSHNALQGPPEEHYGSEVWSPVGASAPAAGRALGARSRRSASSGPGGGAAPGCPGVVVDQHRLGHRAHQRDAAAALQARRGARGAPAAVVDDLDGQACRARSTASARRPRTRPGRTRAVRRSPRPRRRPARRRRSPPRSAPAARASDSSRRITASCSGSAGQLRWTNSTRPRPLSGTCRPLSSSYVDPQHRFAGSASTLTALRARRFGAVGARIAELPGCVDRARPLLPAGSPVPDGAETPPTAHSPPLVRSPV